MQFFGWSECATSGHDGAAVVEVTNGTSIGAVEKMHRVRATSWKACMRSTWSMTSRPTSEKVTIAVLVGFASTAAFAPDLVVHFAANGTEMMEERLKS